MANPISLDDLPHDLALLVIREIAAGRFETVAEVVRAGIEELSYLDRTEKQWIDIVRAAWIDGAAACRRGDPIEASKERPAELVKRLKSALLRAAFAEATARGETSSGRDEVSKIRSLIAVRLDGGRLAGAGPYTLSDFDRWINENCISQSYEFTKAWWDYVDLVQKLSYKFEVHDVSVIGRYAVETPPPEEKLPMPAVLYRRCGVQVAFKWDFGRMRNWPLEWTLSIRRSSPYLGPTFDLFDPSLDLRGQRVDGLGPHWVFGSYRENPAEFTCELEDEWDVATLLRFVFHEV